MEKKAVVLLSGGIDSTTTLAIAKSKGYKVYAITFDYGQKHKKEIEAAKNIAKYFNVEKHIIINIDLKSIGGSALTEDSISIPKNRSLDQIKSGEIPITYVPGRNIIFLSFAVSFAEVVSAKDIFIGVNTIDFSGYPDCRDEFIKAFEKAINLGTKTGVKGDKFKIHTPLINLTKAEIIKEGYKLGVDFSLTWSCYDPCGDFHCGSCDSCILRKEGFKKAEVPDPTSYLR